MNDQYLVCNKCKGDTIGACSQADGQKGFDIYCFDCEAPSNKTLMGAPQCDHNWEHLYNFARCRNCGEDRDIPTASEYANDI